MGVMKRGRESELGFCLLLSFITGVINTKIICYRFCFFSGFSFNNILIAIIFRFKVIINYLVVIIINLT